MSFKPVPTRKSVAGWTADRQRAFIEHLAATGSVTHAAAHVGMSVRSAWQLALRRAGSYLMGIALDRAINGTRREIWKDGKLIATQITPSDKLLMFAIDRLDPVRYTRTPTPDDILDLAYGFQDHETEEEEPEPLPIPLMPEADKETCGTV